MTKPVSRFLFVLLPALLLSCGHHNDTNDAEQTRSELPMKRTVTVLQTKGWANTERAVALIKEYANKIDVDINIQRILVKTDEDVQRHKFIGSPTVRINGLDIDRNARSATQYGFTWRLINWTQGASATEEMLHDAFVEAGWIADSINTKGEQSGAPQTGSSKKSIVDSTP